MREPELDHSLPAVIERYSAPSYVPPAMPVDVEPEDPSVPLSHYLWILKRQRWKILALRG
jgi:hypothetical protein